MAGEAIPLYRPGDDVTATAGVAVAGRKFVEITGALNPANGTNVTVGLPTAGGTVFGVAAYDAAANARVAVIRGSKTIVPVLAAGVIAVGAEVQVDAAGAVITKSAGVAVGRAVTAGTNNAECFVSLY